MQRYAPIVSNRQASTLPNSPQLLISPLLQSLPQSLLQLLSLHLLQHLSLHLHQHLHQLQSLHLLPSHRWFPLP